MVVVATAAGCGGGDDRPSATTSAAQETEAAEASAPDGLEAVVRKCAVTRRRSPTPDVVPAQLRPAHTRIVAATRTDDGFTATLLFDRSPTKVYRGFRADLPKFGYTIEGGETEGFEAELEAERNGERTEMKISALRDCPQYSRATVRQERVE